MHRFAISLLALTVCAAPALAQDANRMQQVIALDADKGEFMGAVLVARDGQLLLDRGYGSANLEWKIPNDGDTKFRLGSVSKQFTAAAILLLQERGKLSLDAPLKTYLADAPAAWEKVTVRHLLSHTGGIPNFTGFPDYEKTKGLPATLDSLIARFRDKPLDFQPGEKFAYSNSGYILLTAIVEKASVQPYAAFVADNIFKPLGMGDSGYDSHAAVLSHRASGYTPSPHGVVNTDYIDMTIPQGAGALYSTTHDLLKWNRGLFGGKLLKPDSLKAMTTPVKDNYALGLFVANADGATVINHGGGIEGFNTWLGYDPDRKLTVVVLGNLNGGAPNRIGKSLMTLARGGPVVLPGERQAVAVPPEKLREYEGVYELAPTFAITMRVEGDKLMTQATGQDAFELFAEKPDRFFLKVVDAQVDFTRDAAGKVTGLVLHQNGHDAPAKRK
ncbi:CubicO group peptidase (beta-lactamase class C family) [Sphingomonas naasensis]|uniref:Serine hydrolase n=1 Tax=Sphingomonas naasensis TaxID=1344951 RepID=A0A4S1W821_9SPHN|nr:serine hydrolase [Sphingomonas naasensis]NIJ19936.1 CubicO group peptidase (beta-lactamase class C family) [Sphingomonas naasensis]TGX37895.1 serine hydrolase [Sphingomonas naasensis]